MCVICVMYGTKFHSDSNYSVKTNKKDDFRKQVMNFRAHLENSSVFKENTSSHNTLTTDQPVTSSDKCISLLTQGKWINWKDFGFFRETKSSIGKIENTRDPLNPDYPNQPPSFREWTKQNYTGAWASSDKHNNCNLLKFRRTDIQSCFSDSERIVVLGDSRSRHIFRTLRV